MRAGAPATNARAAVLLVHGRGGSAEDMLGLAAEFCFADVAYVAPQAEGSTWYPQSFLAPLAANEPWLTSALTLLGDVVAELNDEGVPAERVVMVGFSQGACLAAEFAARHARRFGGLALLSGGLIGPEGTPREYAGSFEGTPAFVGCSDADPHIPPWRVQETAQVLASLGAAVTTRIYPGMGHTVNADEVAAVRAMVEAASLKIRVDASNIQG